MEVKIDKGEKLHISHQLKKNERYKIQKGTKFQSVTIYNNPQIVKGFSNVCEDGKGILVIDYDGVDKSIVLEDYELIQNKFKLPPAYLFATNEDNYHVICLYKSLQSKIFEILTYTRADSNFKTMSLRNPFRSYILRLSDKKGSKKPKFIEIIGKKKNLNKEVSTAHYILLNKMYKKLNPKHPLYMYMDDLVELKFHTYETSK